MKFKFTSKSKSQAEKFQKYIKADRNLESTISDKDGKFYVEYSIAEIKLPEKKVVANIGDNSVCASPQYMDYEEVMCCMNDFASYFFQEMQYQFNWVWAEIDYIENAFYQHVSNGHLPAINGAEKMEKALTALGIGGDYEVKKPVVYANTKYGTTAEVDITASK